MYIKCEDRFADQDFYFLSRFLCLLDTELIQVTKNIKNSKDPDADGLCLYAEYLIGLGFMGMQNYIAATYPQAGMNKKKALKIEPNFTEDATFVEIINAGANYHKHQEEWGTINVIEKNLIKLNKAQVQTIETIQKVTPWDDYTLSNLLAALINNTNSSEKIELSQLLPEIIEWRNNIDCLSSGH